MTLFISGCKWFNDDDKAPDTSAPVIILNGDNPQTIEIGIAYIELGATAADIEDGDLTASISIDASAVDTNTLGSYSVTYDVTDAAGNAATTQTRTVDVVADNTVPVITLVGDDPQTIEVGTAYTELGATASDNIDGDITANIVIDTAAVDTASTGSYSVTYNISDSSGNTATAQTRTVNVVDTTPPVITLTGASPQVINIDDNYSELGATASDNLDGDISSNIVIDASTIDTSILGTYSVTYNISDAAGNAAVTQTRIVNVVSATSNIFLRGSNGIDGRELYITDGTADGTVMVKDINPAGDSNPLSFFEEDGTLYFSAYEDTYGSELWKSDGTDTGTVLVKDINPSGNSYVRDIVSMNGTLYFTASDGDNGRELWKSDGTEAGTIMVKNISPGLESSWARYLTVINDTLYFQANDGTHGYELWKSDGTSDGTVLIKDIYPGVEHSYPTDLTIMNNILYFRANNGANEYELWRSDGTDAGTMMVKDISTGDSRPGYFIEYNNMLFFTATADGGARGLWKSNGTESGTVLVKDIYLSADAQLRYFAVSNGSLFFRAYSTAYGHELWKSDGSSEGTVLVKDIRPGTESANLSNLVDVNGTLYFSATDSFNNTEMWTSDGTADGTTMLKDIYNSGSSYARPLLYGCETKPLILANNQLLVRARTVDEGNELWITDGTTDGTTLVKDINPGVDSGLFATCDD